MEKAELWNWIKKSGGGSDLVVMDEAGKGSTPSTLIDHTGFSLSHTPELSPICIGWQTHGGKDFGPAMRTFIKMIATEPRNPCSYEFQDGFPLLLIG